MTTVITRPVLDLKLPEDLLAEFLSEREWLITNGLGGYASGSILGISRRRYHGLFIPNLPAPYGRTILVPRLDEIVSIASKTCVLSGAQFANGSIISDGHKYLKSFRLESGLPVWTYQFGGSVLEKRIFMPNGQNTVYLKFSIIEGSGLKLQLRPFLTFRRNDDPLGYPPNCTFKLNIAHNRYEILPFEGGPALRMSFQGGEGNFVCKEQVDKDVFYKVEHIRELDAVETLYSPGFFMSELKKDEPFTLVLGTEPWEALENNTDQIAEAEYHRREQLLLQVPLSQQDPFISQLVLATDQFIVLPLTRISEEVLMKASGESLRSIIAGYHWFTDWGRDTMISLEGLTLCTGRFAEAKAILQTFAHYIRNGLLPNHFPEGASTAIYNTVDATLWYFQALERYYHITDDLEIIRFLYPTLQSVIKSHIEGTDFGIHMDAQDSLINASAEGYQLTWMDAKVENWVVTPRRGKPVEIQALWFNALKLMESWGKRLGENVQQYSDLAERVQRSFNEKFWYSEGGYLFDVVHNEKGPDSSLRPNQIFSLSLTFPVLKQEYWKPVTDTVGQKLLTPYGLRTLETTHPDYRPRYAGNRWSRDAAYHQGLVWPWLLGNYIDAWLRVYEDKKKARGILSAFEEHLKAAGVGTISEIFDGEEPFAPGGCIAQAWSVAELLRISLKLSAR